MITPEALSNHICLQSAEKIAQIALPLSKNTPLNYFSYGRYYKDNGTFFFNNNYSEILNEWLLKPEFGLSLKPGTYLWEEVFPKEIFEKLFSLKHGITIVKEYPEYKELISFGTNKDINLAIYFLNNTELANKFSLYFKAKATKLIEEAEKELIYKDQKSTLPTITVSHLASGSELVCNQLDINTFYFQDGSVITFTPREQECFNQFLKGLSSVAIGKNLALSEKTVQSHLKNIKNKFKCKSNGELRAALWNLGAITSDYF